MDGKFRIFDIIKDDIGENRAIYLPSMYKDDASQDEFRPRYSKALDSGEGLLKEAAPDKDWLWNGYLKLDGNYYQVFIYESSTTIREVDTDDDNLLTIDEWLEEKAQYRISRV